MTSYQIDNGNGDVASLGYRFRQRCTCLRSVMLQEAGSNIISSDGIKHHTVPICWKEVPLLAG